MSKRALVTGGSGFIGTNLIEHLHALNYECINCDVIPPRNHSQSELFHCCDILDVNSLVDLVGLFRPNFIFHLAARTDLGGTSLSDYLVNIDGTQNVFRACKQFPEIKVIVFSSQLVNPISYTPIDELDVNPPNYYGQSKVLTEQITRSNDSTHNWVIVRPTTIWGPWFGKKYQGLFRTIKNKRYIHPSGSPISKNWGYVGNICDYALQLAEHPDSCQHTFYLSDLKPYELYSFASKIAFHYDLPSPPKVPFCLLFLIAKFGDLMRILGVNSFPLYSYRLSNMVANMHVDMHHLSVFVSAESSSDIDSSIRNTINWLNDYPHFNRE